MHTTRYLIVGGGLTADAACKGIRDVDAHGHITVVAAEAYPPYARPPLSKALWKGTEEGSIWRGTESLGVELRLGRRIVAFDAAAHRATDDEGEEYGYERLLLATGGRPRRLPFAADDVIYFRTLDDYRRLSALAASEARFVVIGGGFIGSEIAAALAMNGRPVTMVFPEPGIGGRIFPPDLSAFVTDYYRARDVEVLTGAYVAAIERVADTVRVTTGDGLVLETDAVVAGLGLTPSTELAEAAGLEWIAEIGAHGQTAGPDGALHSQPSRAIELALKQDGLAVEDLDLIEINEVFASVVIQSARDLGISTDRINIDGGAIALGHPVGASGARLVLHQALALQRRGGGTGVVGLCGGGGQGDALILRA